jgi:hypothetical protein
MYSVLNCHNVATVAGLIPNGVTGFPIDLILSDAIIGPEVDSACNRN